MNFKVKQQIKDAAQYTYGLASVLKYDADVLRKDANKYDTYKIKESVREINKTLDKLYMMIKEFDCILNLDKNERA